MDLVMYTALFLSIFMCIKEAIKEIEMEYPPATRPWVIPKELEKGTWAIVWTWAFIQSKPLVGDSIIINNTEREILFVQRKKIRILKVYWLIHWKGDLDTIPPEEKDDEFLIAA